MSSPPNSEPKPLNDELSRWVQTRYLGRYLLYCLVGPGAPVLLALIAIPKIVAGLGIERFGILPLVWAIIGYFSLFDLGLGRAAIRLFAERKAQGAGQELRTIVSTALLSTAILGLIGALVMALITPHLVHHTLNLSTELEEEALWSFYVMSIAIPFISLTGTLRGVLEVQQRFRLVNIIQIGLGFLTYLGPLVALLFSKSMVLVVLLLVLTRIFVFILFWWVAIPTLPKEPAARFSSTVLKRLVSMGGWLTVSNIVSPLIVYVDRFFIGSVISMHAVSYYTTTFEAVFRITIFSSAVTQVLYPALSTFVSIDHTRVVRLLRLGTLASTVVVFPVVVGILLFARELLQMWLGAEFAANSSFVLQILVTGVFVNMCAQALMALLQSAERADLAAKMHLVEFIFYIPALYWTVSRYGINGVAILWCVRSTVDYLALLVFSTRLIPEFRGFAVSFLQVTFPFLAGAWVLVQVASSWHRLLFGTVGVLAFFILTYSILLEPEQRMRLRQMVQQLRRT